MDSWERASVGGERAEDDGGKRDDLSPDPFSFCLIFNSQTKYYIEPNIESQIYNFLVGLYSIK